MGVPSEHRDNDRRCDQVQANKRDPAGVVSANAAGAAQEIAVSPIVTWTNRRRGAELRRFSKATSTLPMTAATNVIWAKDASGILP